MAYLKLITAPTTEPVSLDDAKSTLRVDSSDDDALIGRHIREAREWVEARIQRKLATATWEQALDGFPSDEICLDLNPIQSITSVKYDDLSAAEKTIASENYRLTCTAVYPADVWPAAYARDDSVRIQFVVGYASTDLIPAPILAAVHLKIKELYDGDDVDLAIHRLLTNYYLMVA